MRGLARVVEAAGVPIFEQTTVRGIEPGRVETDAGTVRAEVVLRATEGYTAAAGRAAARGRAGLLADGGDRAARRGDLGVDRPGRSRPTFTDGRHLIIYGQRTADGRLAFGGRGAPYHFGSRIRPSYDVEPRVFEDLRAVLRELLPQLGQGRARSPTSGAAASASPATGPPRWGWTGSTGIGWAGGYVGDGVATTNLAGRTLADLVTGADSDLVTLPWVNHRSRRVGARAAALAGHQRGPARDDAGRRRGALDRPAEPDRAADGPAHRRPLSRRSACRTIRAIRPVADAGAGIVSRHVGRCSEGDHCDQG